MENAKNTNIYLLLTNNNGIIGKGDNFCIILLNMQRLSLKKTEEK